MSHNLPITYQKATDSDMPQILSILKALRGDTSDMYVDDFLIAKDEEKAVGCVRIKELPGGTLELASLLYEIIRSVAIALSLQEIVYI